MRGIIVATVVACVLSGVTGCSKPLGPGTAEGSAGASQVATPSVEFNSVEGPWRAAVRAEFPKQSLTTATGVRGALHLNLRDQESELHHIVRYDGRTGAMVSAVGEPKRNTEWARSNSEWLVYELTHSLYAKRIDSDEPTLTLDKRQQMFAPDVWRDWAGWTDLFNPTTYCIRLQNLDTGEIRDLDRLRIASTYNAFVSLARGTVLWTDTWDDVGRYCTYNIETGKRQDYSLRGEYRYPGYARSYDDRIYSINFRDKEQWDWSDQQFGYFDTTQKKWVPLKTEGYIDGFAIAGNTLATAEQGRITLQRLDSDSEPVDVTKLVGPEPHSVQRVNEDTLAVIGETFTPERVDSTLTLIDAR